MGQERPVVVVSGEAYSLEPMMADLLPSAYSHRLLAEIREAVLSGVLPRTSIEGLRVGAPIADLRSIIAVGMNYAAHAAESGSPPPEHVVVFFRKPNSAVGPTDDVRAIAETSLLDWEVELGIVIGSHLTGEISADDAMAGVAGYVMANDLSDRYQQLEVSGGQWSKGKSFAASCPLGPWVATADEIPDVASLRLRSWVNGEARQDSSTSDMIFSVDTIVRELAKVMVLEPGDLVLTGTPEGVALSGRFPYLMPGDRVNLAVDGLGEIVNVVLAPGY